MKQFTIPKKVKIGALTYKVKIVSEEELPKNACGVTIPTTLEILVLNCKNSYNIFLHELVHTFLLNSGYNKHNEDFVESMAQNIYAYLVDNGGF